MNKSMALCVWVITAMGYSDSGSFASVWNGMLTCHGTTSSSRSRGMSPEYSYMSPDPETSSGFSVMLTVARTVGSWVLAVGSKYGGCAGWVATCLGCFKVGLAVDCRGEGWVAVAVVGKGETSGEGSVGAKVHSLAWLFGNLVVCIPVGSETNWPWKICKHSGMFHTFNLKLQNFQQIF